MPFKKGKSGNPVGRPRRVPSTLQRAAADNRIKVKQLVLEMANLTDDERRAILTDPSKSGIEKMVAGTIQDCVDNRTFCRTLIEIGTGPLTDQAGEFKLSDNEKELIRQYRTALAEKEISPALTDDSRDTEKQPPQE